MTFNLLSTPMSFPTPITRSTVWFSDGNVVLQVRNIQFCVHWGVLALHSSVFRDMRRRPQPHGEPNVDGCPVMQLSDNPTDVEYLLNALYDPTFLAQKTLPFASIGAFIRLGRKYNLKNVLDLAVARVTAVCPTTLRAFDTLVDAGPRSWDTIEWYYGIEFDLVTLLNENNIWSALPCAYYRAVRHTQEEFFDGINKGDGTRISLSQRDLRRCAIGHHTLSHKQFEPGYTFGWARERELTGCTSSAVCRSLREEILKDCTEKYEILALVGPSWLRVRNIGFCAACRQHAKKSLAAGKKKIWQELPQIFDLSPWSELLKNDP
ncbi:hypothetical protein C8R45DRAFT_1204280 [Mycena sanguinolenta]|nr:hypothetical protein C8R45DRAFT_1204280 [Mycena sanguinolenta]